MIRFLIVLALAVSGVDAWAEDKPVLVVNPFTAAPGVDLPYDMKQLQSQMVAELRVMLGKQFDVVPEHAQTAGRAIYTLDAEFTGWRAGNVAKRLFVGLGSGREASDIQYRVTDAAGNGVIDRKDTVRTNFYAQTASTGTLAHPLAQKIAERIRAAKLR